MQRRTRLLALCFVTLMSGACATNVKPRTCALFGAGAGAVGGGVGGAVYSDENDGEEGEAAGIALGSVVGGAALGYLMCRIFYEEPAPPPPPRRATPVRKSAPPPPPPPPRPTRREPDPCDRLVTLQGVSFESNAATLRADAQSTLASAASALASCPRKRVRVEAHTDGAGPEAYNQALSERRAESVMMFLRERGIAASRLEAVGYGEARPIAPNDTREGRAKNRRVELRPLD